MSRNNFIAGNGGANRLSGGDGNDILSGGGGDDILLGGRGNDTLYGGAGNDRFVIDTLEGIDRIMDFRLGDILQLDHNVFNFLNQGPLNPDAFAHGTGLTSGVDADDRIIFDNSTGNLYYDADGAGAAATAIQIATLVDDHFAYNWGWSFSAADIVVG
jgi:cysteinyl-tRNA synthetase